MKQSQFISSIVGLARQFHQRAEGLLERGPSFFSKGGQLAYRDVETGYRTMYESSVKTLVPTHLSGEFKGLVKKMQDDSDHVRAIDAAIKTLGADYNPHHAIILRGAASAYFYARQTIDYMKRLGRMSRAELDRFAEKPENRHEASTHFERFARLYALTSQHGIFESELEHHTREVRRINEQIQIPGIDHHYVPTEMHLFHGLHPSVFGGDHFNLVKFQDLPEGEELYGVHLVDVAGHSEPYWSPINSVRTMLGGIDEAVGEFASGRQILRNPEHYLQRIAALVNNALEKRKHGGTGLFGLIDAKRGKLYYLSTGHALPAIYHNNKLLDVQHAGGPQFGVDYQQPGRYSVGCIDLKPGMVVKMWTDGIPERKVKRRQVDISEPLDAHFATLAEQGLDSKAIAHGIIREAQNRFDGRVFSDDGSVFVFRYRGHPDARNDKRQRHAA